jgi:hypothetical protein
MKMKNTKNALLPTSASSKILDEMVEIEKEFERKREEKKNELEAVRQDLIAKLQKVDEYLGTNSFGAAKNSSAKGRRLRRGELEKFIKDALAKGPAPIGEILKRIHANGLDDKDGSIRSKMGNSKWIAANSIVKNGNTYIVKK